MRGYSIPSRCSLAVLRISQIWLTAVGDSVTDLPPFSRVTSGWLTSGYSQLASARTQDRRETRRAT